MTTPINTTVAIENLNRAVAYAKHCIEANELETSQIEQIVRETIGSIKTADLDDYFAHDLFILSRALQLFILSRALQPN